MVAATFTGFSPLELLDMEVTDLIWWLGQAEKLAEEMKKNGG